MAEFVEVSDFTGVYLLAKDTYSVDEIQEFIDEYERKSLTNLLGATLTDLLIDNQYEPEYVAIIEPFDMDLCGSVIHSDGLKKYLLGIIYYEYVVSGRLSPSVLGGAVEIKVEAGETHTSRSEIFQRYNKAIDTGKAIQQKIISSSDIYPSFNGQKLLYNY